MAREKVRDRCRHEHPINYANYLKSCFLSASHTGMSSQPRWSWLLKLDFCYKKCTWVCRSLFSVSGFLNCTYLSCLILDCHSALNRWSTRAPCALCILVTVIWPSLTCAPWEPCICQACSTKEWTWCHGVVHGRISGGYNPPSSLPVIRGPLMASVLRGTS